MGRGIVESGSSWTQHRASGGVSWIRLAFGAEDWGWTGLDCWTGLDVWGGLENVERQVEAGLGEPGARRKNCCSIEYCNHYCNRRLANWQLRTRFCEKSSIDTTKAEIAGYPVAVSIAKYISRPSIPSFTIASPHYATMSTTTSLLSTWHTRKQQSALPARLGMRSLEVISVAAAMLVIPSLIQRLVRSVDDVYELLGRRARSPYVAVSWTSIVVAVVMLLGWHLWLGRLSYRVVLEDSGEEEIGGGVGKGARISWGRVLGRVVIPLLLLVAAVHFVYEIVYRAGNPAPFVTGNTVDVDEGRSTIGGLR